MDSFSNKLRKLLNAKHWNQVEAARELGITQSQISDYLSGKSEPYLSTAAAIAKKLGVSLDELSGVDSSGFAVKEDEAAYITDAPYQYWVEALKRRWRRKATTRTEMELSIRILFPDDAEKMIEWLNRFSS